MSKGVGRRNSQRSFLDEHELVAAAKSAGLSPNRWRATTDGLARAAARTMISIRRSVVFVHGRPLFIADCRLPIGMIVTYQCNQ